MRETREPEEHLKNRANAFGGFQYTRLASIEIERRYCAALNCGDRGKRQIPVPGGYRIVCGKHSAMLLAMTLGVLGQPNAATEVREHADLLGVDFGEFLLAAPVHPAMWQWFRCLQCGGGLEERDMGTAEQRLEIGYKPSIVYVHTCKEES